MFARLLILAPLMLGTASFADSGNEGGGGGGAIVCPGKKPELTDLWEISQRQPQFREQVEELRKVNRIRAYEFLAKQLGVFFRMSKASDVARLYDHLDSIRSATDRAVIQSRTQILPKTDKTAAKRFSIDLNAEDPQDSGLIFGLKGTGCHEERVAVTTIDINTGLMHLTIRRPDIYKELPDFDKTVLTGMHEAIQGSAQGRVADLLVAKGAHPSTTTRELTQWILLSPREEIKSIYAFAKPGTVKTLRCSAFSQGSNREGWTTDRIHFNLLLDENGTSSIFQLTNFRDENVWLPTFTMTKIEHGNLYFPEDRDLNVGEYEEGQSFRLVMDLPMSGTQPALMVASQPVMIPHLRQSSGFMVSRVENYNKTYLVEKSAGLSVQFTQQADGKIRTILTNTKTGDVEFAGETLCYSKVPANKKR